jgi:hypothetical protein
MCDWGGGPNSMANYLTPVEKEPTPMGPIVGQLKIEEETLKKPLDEIYMIMDTELYELRKNLVQMIRERKASG